MTEEEWETVVRANLKSVQLCTQAAARRMPQGGAIVNVASIEGLQPMPDHAHYAASKAAVLMHTRAAALELGSRGIRVNAVSPGLLGREGLEAEWPEGVERWLRVVPLGRMGTSRDVADACLFLASEAARWITGANLVVDGGGVIARQAF
jgi:3-oxoacyl-[acyl-carrier protein] reductase